MLEPWIFVTGGDYFQGEPHSGPINMEWIDLTKAIKSLDTTECTLHVKAAQTDSASLSLHSKGHRIARLPATASPCSEYRECRVGVELRAQHLLSRQRALNSTPGTQKRRRQGTVTIFPGKKIMCSDLHFFFFK